MHAHTLHDVVILIVHQLWQQYLVLSMNQTQRSRSRMDVHTQSHIFPHKWKTHQAESQNLFKCSLKSGWGRGGGCVEGKGEKGGCNSTNKSWSPDPPCSTKTTNSKFEAQASLTITESASNTLPAPKILFSGTKVKITFHDPKSSKCGSEHDFHKHSNWHIPSLIKSLRSVYLMIKWLNHSTENFTGTCVNYFTNSYSQYSFLNVLETFLFGQRWCGRCAISRFRHTLLITPNIVAMVALFYILIQPLALRMRCCPWGTLEKKIFSLCVFAPS